MDTTKYKEYGITSTFDKSVGYHETLVDEIHHWGDNYAIGGCFQNNEITCGLFYPYVTPPTMTLYNSSLYWKILLKLRTYLNSSDFIGKKLTNSTMFKKWVKIRRWMQIFLKYIKIIIFKIKNFSNKNVMRNSAKII